MKKKTISGIVIVLFAVVIFAAFTLLFSTPQANASPPDTPPGKEKGEKVTICHIPPGNPRQAKTMEIPRAAVPAHLAHGDTYGRCFVKVEEIETESPIEDFRLDEEGNIKFLLTNSELKIFSENLPIAEIPNSSEKNFIFSSDKASIFVFEFHDIGKEGPENASYKFFDDQGNELTSGNLPNLRSIDRIELIASDLFILVHDAQIRKLNLNSGTVEWGMNVGREYEVVVNTENQTFFLFEPLNELEIRSLNTGELLRETKIVHSALSVSDKGNLFYVVERENDDVRVLLFNSELEKINEWGNLSVQGSYHGFIDENLNTVLIPRPTGNIFLAGFGENQLTKEIPYPVQPFTPSVKDSFFDGINGILFLSGIELDVRNIFTENFWPRSILILNVVNQRISGPVISDDITAEIGKKRYIQVRGNSSNQHIAFQTENKISIYRYDF
jgi:hypothetical protein